MWFRFTEVDSAGLTRILIVDDDPSIRFVLRLILERESYEIVEATNGEAALDMLRLDPLPDLVTTDLMMPLVSGIELIERLRAEPRTSAIPIVVISGNPEAVLRLKAPGFVDATISKPFDVVGLVEAIRLLIKANDEIAKEGRA